MPERNLSDEVRWLPGVGPRGAVGLNKVGVFTAGDLLYYLPRRYEDRSHLPKISSLKPGVHATVRGTLGAVDTRSTRGGMVILRAVLRDGTGSVALTWFNQPWVRKQLESVEGEIIAYGMVKENGTWLEIASPEWESLGEDDDPDEFARIVPVYPLTEGLSQKTVRKAARFVVTEYLGMVQDPLPEDLRRQEKLGDLKQCLAQMHAPTSEPERLEARRRLVFEEFFYLQVAMAMRRAETQQELGISFPISRLVHEGTPGIMEKALERAKAQFNGRTLDPATEVREVIDSNLFESEQAAKREGEALWSQIHRMLPFDLTGAQRRVIGEAWADMERPHPMNRLVQGDVGSGKTAVAACCLLAAVRCGFQGALMAPTEILAEQHYVNLHRLFDPFGIEVALLVGKLSIKDKRKALDHTARGQAKIAIGTHALIQEGVQFANLGFVVIDEQHRFGVLQRKALRDKGVGNPDVMVMTATPIPRTLTMTLYGDLDLSVIDELPPGRRPVKTHWKRPMERESVYHGVLKLLEEGRQAYFVCPMVSESEKMLAQAAEDLHYRLSTGVFEHKRVGLLHGQMKAVEKEAVMEAFRRNELDILVSTTVIEVGVDVPNASVMVIEDANRFGLSQLHQLRGRVGRGAHQSFCIMIADATNDDTRERLETMVETTDGFKIAEKDLQLRGPGELAGTKQSGNLDFKIADLVQDGKMLEVARAAAMRVVEDDPTLEEPKWKLTLERVRSRRSEMAVITVS